MDAWKNTRVRPMLEIVGIFAVAALPLGAAWHWLSAYPLALQGVVWVVYIMTMVLIGWILKGVGGWKTIGLISGNKKFWGKTLAYSLITVVMALASFVLGGALATNLGWVSIPADLSAYQFLKGNAGLVILTLLAVYVSSSLGEEVVFRGFLITRLQEIFKGRWPSFAAVAISGLVFGLVHMHWGLMGMVQTACMGWALGYCYIRFGKNLWVTVLAHAYMDTVLIVQMY